MAGSAYSDDYPLVGECLGFWGLLRGIGRGGMGEVYEAEYDFVHVLSLHYKPEERPRLRKELQTLSRQELAAMASEMLGTNLSPEARFAVKVCNARRGTAGYKRFLQEAEWAKKLGVHPYIISVHAIHGNSGKTNKVSGNEMIERGKHRDLAFMVMDLAKRSYDQTTLDYDQAVHMVRCIATALDHAHTHGVIHRDLKPENILGSATYPLLTDFGIAKEMDHTQGLTRTGQIIGTLDYMSPEQATDAKRVDKRSDVYSLGVVLYEFATRGSLPYYHITERENCLAAIRSEHVEPRWPRYYDQDIPKSLEYIILKAMAHRPEERYQQMSDFITDLDRFTRGERILPFRRIHLRRWFFAVRARHPKLLYGIPTAIAMVLLIFILSKLPNWLDGTYQRLEFEQRTLQQSIEKIKNRQTMQLSKEHDKLLSVLGADYERNNGQMQRDYPKHYENYVTLTEELQEHRILVCRFHDDDMRVQVDPRNALNELKLASRNERLDVQLVDGSGLVVRANERLDLKSYGVGGVYVYLRAKAQDGLAIHVHEAETPRRFTTLRLRGGKLECVTWRDEEPPQIKYEEPIFGNDLAVGLSVSSEGIKVFTPRHQSEGIAITLPALRDQAPAAVSFELPRGLSLYALECWPE